MTGHGFLNIPEDALGIFASDNNNPLQYIDTDVNEWLFELSIIDDTQLTATCIHPNIHTGSNYLGAIVSADRQTVYWINNTNPLP